LIDRRNQTSTLISAIFSSTAWASILGVQQDAAQGDLQAVGEKGDQNVRVGAIPVE